MRNSSKLLISEHPLVFQPSLAVAVGVNEAIFIQQLHYWLEKSKHQRDGFFWVYNTYEDWQEQLPFWSVSTIRRAVTNLTNQEIIIKGNYNKLKIDKTNWYRIDYEKLDSLIVPSVQDEQSNSSKRTVDQFNLNRTLPEITSENKEVVKAASLNNEEPNAYNELKDAKINLSFNQLEDYKYYSDVFDQLVIIEALNIAKKQNKIHWGYIAGILKQWQDKGIKTVEDVKALDSKQPKQPQKKKPEATDLNAMLEKLKQGGRL